MPTYRKPPILEAVIGVHLASPLEDRVRERFRLKVEKEYPRLLELREFHINAEQKTVAVNARGYQLQSADTLDRIVLLPGEFNLARLAPYLGWDQLATRAAGDWATLLTIEQHPRLEKLATRYINRIDIPVPRGSEPPDLRDYFRISIAKPEGCFEEKNQSFTLTFEDFSPDHRTRFRIELSTVVPELIDNVSVRLDIEAQTAEGLPSRLDEAWGLLDHLHEMKNQYFEMIITDKARKLFE
jgi:uncharacterized protein (TIGR04255 family)